MSYLEFANRKVLFQNSVIFFKGIYSLFINLSLIFFFSDPPLEEEDIPKGEWLCHSCKYVKKQTSVPALRNKRSISTPISSDSSISSLNGKMSTKKVKFMNPMEMLIEAASAMNPTQFELPRSMSVPCIFPGTDKGKKNKTADDFH